MGFSRLLQLLADQVEHLSHVQTDPHSEPVTATVKNGKGVKVFDLDHAFFQTASKRRHLSSFLDNSDLAVKAVKADKNGTDSNGSKDADGVASVSLYNPENRRIFLVAAPITIAMAAFFECSAKYRMAETDLSAPLPQVVEAATKEEEASSLKSAVKVLEPYIMGPTSLKCVGYAAAHVTLLGVGLYVDVALTQWNGVFWTALQNHQSKQFYRLLWDFVIITGVTGFVGTYSDYLNGMWHLHARDHLTRHFNQLWVSTGAMCMMRQSSVQVDNPDQRIDQDVDEFVGSTRELVFGGLGSVVRLAIYFPILLRSAPAPLLGFVLVWPVFGALVTHGLGRRLIPLSVAGQSANANFRSELVYAREKAESLALMRAGPQLAQNLQDRFEVMKRVAYAEFDVTKFLNFFKMMYEEYGTVVPFVLLAPAYFTGALDLGQLMQLRMIVERVSQSLTFPVAAYEQAVGWRVAANRLAALAAASASTASSTVSSSPEGVALKVDGLYLRTPEGRLLLENLSLEVSFGERLLVVLPASGGKSLLLRALAGLWSHMSGSVEKSDDAVFIQGFEFPPLSLRQLLCYPQPAEGDSQLALHMVDLASLLARYPPDRQCQWEEVLSPEEQQRLLIARLLLRQPRLALLDEPLAALSEEDACGLLRQISPETAIVSFSRTRRLAAAHHRVVELGAAPDWVPSVSDLKSEERKVSAARPIRLGHNGHNGHKVLKAMD
mmetsp:Transcript_1668/g.2924  ORF Transcript_1668/g.2924 Transcript_1668/m.2924 type:complete len:721 (+) Transcript_1668:31-2193(+)